jgi:hypothetical protein
MNDHPWTNEIQNIYQTVSPAGELSQEEREILRDADYSESQLKELFETGFTHHRNEPGYDQEAVQDARERFVEIINMLGYSDNDIDWESWREWMGY